MTEDRRIRRTQRLLHHALIELILERGYRNITIQEVSARADIGYRTFFRHYNSLDDLLLDVIQETLDELDRRLDLYRPESDLEGVLLHKGIGLFRFVQEREAIFRVLLLDDGVRFTIQPLLNRARSRAQAAIPPQEGIPASIVANHLIISTLALLRWWLEFDLAYPPEEMGQFFLELIIRPLWSAISQS